MNTHNNVTYIGVNDTDIDLFEGQYQVPNGISYNSYLIKGEKIALTDTVDIRKFDEWQARLNETLGDKAPDYLIIHHLEPDHAGSIAHIIAKYPNITLVGNAKTFAMLPQFFKCAQDCSRLMVKDGDTLDLGGAELTFITAPMVHWPEVMVSYEAVSGTLFSADAFGKFGIPGSNDNTIDEMRRYYINIVGKYGAPVQALLKKAAALDIKKICPLHGPVIDDNKLIAQYINLYDTWSKYRPENNNIFIAYASIYGSTKKAALKLEKALSANGINVTAMDTARTPLSECVAEAFRSKILICAAPSYDGGIFTPMADFINHLKTKAFQSRTVGFIENGSWAPCAAKAMADAFSTMKNITFCQNTVTVKSTPDNDTDIALQALSDELKALNEEHDD